MNYKKYVSSSVIAGAVMAFAMAVPAFASADTVTQGNPPGNMMGFHGGMGMNGGEHGVTEIHPATVGKVTAIDGTSITVTSIARQGFGPAASSTSATQQSTVFTVDASNATVLKGNATSSVSVIAVGDIVVVEGTTSGTSITATTIRDGFAIPGMRPNGQGGNRMGTSTSARWNRGEGSSTPMNGMTSPIAGNGQPIVAGNVSAINGSTLTITNKSNVTYTIDASNAKIVEGQNAISVSNIAVGDNVIVQGTISETSVTASSIIDERASGTASTSPANGHPGSRPAGIFGSIGGFFMHIFGF
jgi:hypothetical protein